MDSANDRDCKLGLSVHRKFERDADEQVTVRRNGSVVAKMPQSELSRIWNYLTWGPYQLLRELVTSGGIGYPAIGRMRFSHMQELLALGLIEQEDHRIRVRSHGEEFLRKAVYVPARSQFVSLIPVERPV